MASFSPHFAECLPDATKSEDGKGVARKVRICTLRPGRLRPGRGAASLAATARKWHLRRQRSRPKESAGAIVIEFMDDVEIVIGVDLFARQDAELVAGPEQRDRDQRGVQCKAWR